MSAMPRCSTTTRVWAFCSKGRAGSSGAVARRESDQINACGPRLRSGQPTGAFANEQRWPRLFKLRHSIGSTDLCETCRPVRCIPRARNLSSRFGPDCH